MLRPRHCLPILLLAALGPQVLAPPVSAYPVPASVATRWELAFRPGSLRLWLDPEEDRWYMHLVYEIANHTGRDQVWAPLFTIFTDTGEILSSGRGVPSRVVEAIGELLGDELLETQHEIIGDLLQGETNAKSGLVVWPLDAGGPRAGQGGGPLSAVSTTPRFNELSLFVTGISGENTQVRNPLTGQNVNLRKTLHRHYLVPGDAAAREGEPITPHADHPPRWIFR